MSRAEIASSKIYIKLNHFIKIYPKIRMKKLDGNNLKTVR